MSVCFFVPAEQNATNQEETEGEQSEENRAETAEQTLQQFWAKVMEDIKNVSPDDFKTQPLPLTRIKKIMKLDEDVKMISAEAPVLFAKAAEIFIHELTLRSWNHTEDNKRRTLQRNDIAMAISKSDQFDFLIDIVPRCEMKASNKPRFDAVWSKTNEQTSQQQQTTTIQTAPQQQIVLQPGCTQVIQTSSGASPPSVQQPVTLVQQVVQPDVTTIPGAPQIQLTQAQLNMIRLQVQNNPSQPIIIQAQAQQSPQIIQVGQAQHQPQQQVYIAQVASSQDDS